MESLCAKFGDSNSQGEKAGPYVFPHALQENQHPDLLENFLKVVKGLGEVDRQRPLSHLTPTPSPTVREPLQASRLSPSPWTICPSWH